MKMVDGGEGEEGRRRLVGKGGFHTLRVVLQSVQFVCLLTLNVPVYPRRH